ncbi:MAG: zinc ABC transporter substrate-binding protein [Rhizobiaceae bacterium]|nr:zinc ABC transporter substrate-binding protein [Rhizobiaceae bacterium]
MTRFGRALLAGTALAVGATGPAAAFEGVVASIKPVHSLVAAVMGEVGEPSLLVSGAGSPHTYSMRPSEAQMLESASVVFWVGHDLEMFLDGPLDTLSAGATVVELGEVEGLTKLPYREDGAFESHEDETDDAAAGDDHAHDHAHEHEDEEEEAAESHDDHAHGGQDMHFWLDPENARAMVGAIEAALSEADPDNAQAYAANAAATVEKIDALTAETQAAIDGVDNHGFVVFHDAYQYYEKRFGIEAAGSITVTPDVMPGAQRLSEIQARVKELGAACVFSEPQFEPRLVSVITEGTDAKAGVLDPLGADLEDGPELYFDLIRNLTTSLTTCLAGEG